MRITKLKIQNIGVFEDQEIEFKEKTIPDKAEIHIFTGENGTGKSTILYVLASLLNLHFISSRFHKTKKPYFEVNFGDGNVLFLTNRGNSYVLNLLGIMTNYQVSINTLQDLIDNLKTVNNNFKGFEFAFFAYAGYRNVGNHTINAIQELTENPLEDVLNFNRQIPTQILLQWIANSKTKEALAAQKNNLPRVEKYRKSIERIEFAISEITGKSIKFIFEDEPIMQVLVKVNEVELSFNTLPDGLKSILSWVSDLLMRLDRTPWATDEDVFDRNFILFLDEIEVHLHPAWQRKILPVIQKLFKNAQIFISTHSPFVIGSVDGAWVYKLGLENGNAKVLEITESSVGDSLSLILEEVFDIKTQFAAPSVENEFKEFYVLREELLHKNFANENLFLDKAKLLALHSIEIQNIVGREIRQLNRVLQKNYAL
jgi:predicted ATP-binding protein involved in virulence